MSTNIVRVWFRYEPALWAIVILLAGMIVATILITSIGKRHYRRALVYGWAAVITSLVGFAIVSPLLFEAGFLKDRQQYRGKIELIGHALDLYAIDYDEKLPLAKNWGTETAKYVRAVTAETDAAFQRDHHGYAFAYNGFVASKHYWDLAPDTVLLSEYDAASINEIIVSPDLIPADRHAGQVLVYAVRSKVTLLSVPAARAAVSMSLKNSISEAPAGR